MKKHSNVLDFLQHELKNVMGENFTNVIWGNELDAVRSAHDNVTIFESVMDWLDEDGGNLWPARCKEGTNGKTSFTVRAIDMLKMRYAVAHTIPNILNQKR